MKSLLHWPRTLAARLALIFLAGLVFAYSLSFCSQFYERYQSARNMMLGNLETDVSTAVALLDRLPRDERQAWLPMVQRPNYRYLLSEGQPGEPMNMAQAPMAAQSIFSNRPSSQPSSSSSLSTCTTSQLLAPDWILARSTPTPPSQLSSSRRVFVFVWKGRK